MDCNKAWETRLNSCFNPLCILLPIMRWQGNIIPMLFDKNKQAKSLILLFVFAYSRFV
jgi:hypothetical protein